MSPGKREWTCYPKNIRLAPSLIRPGIFPIVELMSVVLSQKFKKGLGMIASRAPVRRLGAFKNIPAVAALPGHRRLTPEDPVPLNIFA